MDIVEQFKDISGLSLSKSKTEFLGIRETKAQHMGLATVNQIKCVRAFVTKKQGPEENNINYEHAMGQIKLVHRSWEWRYPSPIGAAVISKSLMTSTLMHLLVNFNPEPEIIKEYEKTIRNFIWRGRSQVQKQRMEQPIGRGGMNVTSLPDFMTALRIRWYRQLCIPGLHQNWKTTLEHWLQMEGLTVADIPKMGFPDLGILADKLNDKGLQFWAKTFKQISHTAEIWEEETDNFAMLPVFGGLLAKKANKNGRAKWLSFFNTAELSIKPLFHSYLLVARVLARPFLRQIVCLY
jgi:hypothetical protein